MKISSLLLASLALGTPLCGGTFFDDYESYAQGAVSLAPIPGQLAVCAGNNSAVGGPTCSVQPTASPKYLRLTANGTGSSQTSYKLPDLDPNLELSEFTIEFDLRMYSTAPADGFSLNVGMLPADNGTGEGGFAMFNGLTLAWDTYDNGGEPRSIEVIANAIQVANVLQSSIPTAFVIDSAIQTPLNFRHVKVHWDSAGLDLEITPLGSAIPVAVYTNQATPGFLPSPGYRIGFSARTGGSSQDTFIDNLSVTTSAIAPPTTTEPIISEILADNEGGLEDEDFTHPDWLEIYNGTPAVVNLNGWYLTDDAANLTKWQIPAITVPVYGYTWLFASGKDRRTGSCYHTNFMLPKTGGTVRLVKPDGVTVAHTLTYGPQDLNTSYGFIGAGITFGYLDNSSPGVRNSGLQAPGQRAGKQAIGDPPAGGPGTGDDLVFLKEDPAVNPAAPRHVDGTITAATNVWFRPLVSPDAEIRYTTNATMPNSSSALYTGAAIPVTGSRAIRARVFQPGRLPGETKTLSLVMLGSSITNYRNSGAAFKSNLPILVMDSFTANVDGTTNPLGARPYRYTYTIGYDPSLGTGGKASISDAPQFATNAGTHVRGQSSSGFLQRPYALETWDGSDQDKEVAMFSLPPGSDWALYDPYNEETLMRNKLVYDSMLDFRGQGSAMRTQFIEVFFNQDNGTVDYADYRGVYVLVEKIKRDNDRVNIEKLNNCISDPALITGGYIFKKDKTPYQVTVGTTTGQPWGAQTWEVVEPNFPSAQQKTYLQTTIQAFENVLSSATYNNPDTGYRAHIDVPSFIDNHIWVEAYKQIDGYRISAYYTKERGQKIKALPIWDYNLAAGNANYLTGEVPFGWYYSKVSPGGNYPHYSRLFQDPAFVLEYWDRFWMIRRHHLTDAAVTAQIDSYSTSLRDSIATNVSNTGGFPSLAPAVENPVGRHFNRYPRLTAYDWPNANNFAERTTFQSETEWLKQWMRQRLQWMEMLSIDPAPSGMMRMRPVNVHNTANRAEVYQANVPAGHQVDLADPNGIAGGQIYYTLDGTDPRTPAAAVSGTAVLATGGAVTPTAHISMGSTWAWTESLTSAPANDAEGDNWKMPAFNDSAWLVQAAKIGFGTGPVLATNLSPTVTKKALSSNVATLTLNAAPPWPVGTSVTVALTPVDAVFNGLQTITAVSTVAPFTVSYAKTNADVAEVAATGTVSKMPASNAHHVLYTRKKFNVTGAANNYELIAQLQVDDGAVIYLNGNEVWRHNMSAPPIAIGFTSRAVGAVDAGGGDVSIENVAVPVRIPTSALVEGENTIAVEVHQFLYGSGNTGIANNNDMYFDMELKSTALTPGTPITFTTPGPTVLKSRIKNGTNWSPLTTSTLVVEATPASAANLVVSEFHYHPADPTAAEIAAGFNNGNDFEYIELTNISAEAVDMTGVTLANAVDFDFTNGSTAARYLPAGGRVLIVENASAFASRHPGVTAPVAGAFNGNLSNNGERITILAANGSVIKDFTYDDEEPWPVAADGPRAPEPPTGRSYSLVLNNPWTNPDHTLPSSWRASATANGSPGAADGHTLTTSPAGDVDGDGLTNLVEHASGQNRLPGVSWGLYTPPEGTEGTYLLFTFPRDLTADGVSCQPELSTDLVTWSTAGLTYYQSQHNQDGTASVTWRSTLPASALPSRFLVRLRVQQVP